MSCWVWPHWKLWFPSPNWSRSADGRSTRVRYSSWRGTTPSGVPCSLTSQRLTELSQDDFEALERFAATAGGYPAATQNAVLGEWNALVELISRGVQAGSIGQSAGAAAFRRVCQDLMTPGHSTKALAVLRGIAGSGDLHEAVAGNLLRLDGERRGGL